MSVSFLHGIEVIETEIGPVPIIVVKSGVIGLVGTAPKWAATKAGFTPNAINTPILVNGPRDAAKFGPLVKGYSIPYALQAIYQQGSAPQVIVIDVCDPTKHVTSLVAPLTLSAKTAPNGGASVGQMGLVTAKLYPTTATVVSSPESHTLVAGAINTTHAPVNPATMVLKDSTDTTTYVLGTDYTFDASTGLITRIVGGAIPTATSVVHATYSYYSGSAYILNTDYTVDLYSGVYNNVASGALNAGGESVIAVVTYEDPTKISDADIIGAVTSSGGSNGSQGFTGAQCFLSCFQTFGFWPKILIAPDDAGLRNVDVIAAFATLAKSMRAMYIVDSVGGTSGNPAQQIANRSTIGNPFDTSDERAYLWWPSAKFQDTAIIRTGVTLDANGAPVIANDNSVQNIRTSQYIAGVMAQNDFDNGYWFSPSNKQVNGLIGPAVLTYMSFTDANSDTNNLNAVGIATYFNGFATGLRTWGNRSAAYPSATTPNVFVSVRRTLDVVEESVQLGAFPFLDQPISNGLITSILQSVNAFIRTLIQRGALVQGSKITFNPSENPQTEIAAGHLTFDIDCIPPPPLERITFQTFVDINLLSNLGASLNGTRAAV